MVSTILLGEWMKESVRVVMDKSMEGRRSNYTIYTIVINIWK